MARFDVSMVIPSGSLTTDDLSSSAGILSTQMAQRSNAVWVIDPTHWRVHDAAQTNLPGTGASDDLAIVGTTYGTDAISIQTGDVKALGATTRYARCLFALPANYQDGETVTIRAYAGMKTTVADVTATIDFQAYKSDNDTTIGGSDLVTTSATTINSLTFANKDFSITTTELAAGDVLDIRMAIITNDAATATAVIGCAGKVSILVDTRG